MSTIERFLLANLPPESGPYLLAAAEWWPLVSLAALALAVSVLIGCLGLAAGMARP
jgi:hypothetical protein